MTSEEQRGEFTFKLGLVLRPVLDVVEQPTQYSEPERRQVRGRFNSDLDTLHNELHQWCFAEPGSKYNAEWNDIAHQLNALRQAIDFSLVGLPHPPRLKESIDNARYQLVASIAAVPIWGSSQIFDAQTPFTSYLRLKAICESCIRRLVCVDRYMDQTIFHRQLAETSPSVEITLITRRRTLTAAFLDVSRLFADERASKYRLLTDESFHDRWLRCDDELYVLGGSIKDAGSKSVYTIARSTFPSTELAKVDTLIASATEVFGRNSPVHP